MILSLTICMYGFTIYFLLRSSNAELQEKEKIARFGSLYEGMKITSNSKKTLFYSIIYLTRRIILNCHKWRVLLDSHKYLAVTLHYNVPNACQAILFSLLELARDLEWSSNHHSELSHALLPWALRIQWLWQLIQLGFLCRSNNCLVSIS